MARKRANLTDLLNDLTYKVIFDKYKLLAMNAFKWGGLPDGITERHIERHLFDRGYAAWYDDPNMSYMCLEASSGGPHNWNGDPLAYNLFGIGYTRRVSADDCVIIENNMLRLPTKDVILFYVNKIAEAERTMDVNIKANKSPVILMCDNNDVLSFKRVFQMVDGNTPAIFADRSMNMDGVQALDLKAKFLGNDLMDYKHSVEAELMTFLGINNPAVDKKERLITDEANSNNQLIYSYSEMQLEARRRACEAINAKYGLNLTVERRQTEQPAPEKEADNAELV